MTDVYSVRFLQALNSVPPDIGTYTVPAGYRAVLRDVWFTAYSLSSRCFFEIAGAGGQKLWHVESSLGVEETFFWQGRQVFNAGESMQMAVTQGAGDYTASGYLLTLP